jgi:leucyl-tRNA---protein transferase
MYLSWNEQTITDFSSEKVANMYHNGYVFTRVGKGVMKQTRSVRINLTAFTLSSENRRIIKKTEGLSLATHPLPYAAYDFSIGKLGKDFYDTKFEKGTMSAQKIKEMMTDAEKSNFNLLLTYQDGSTEGDPTIAGYTICYHSSSLIHYSYPFYDLNSSPKDMGMGMMVRAISFAKESGLPYIYLGSLQRPSDTYKLQFEGLEWFDGKEWKTDISEAKRLLAEV